MPACMERARKGHAAPSRQRPLPNPVFAGDHPDPSLLKGCEDYYVTFSSFELTGLVIWHSRDLVELAAVTAALRKPIGSVWRPELCRHQDVLSLHPGPYCRKRSIYVNPSRSHRRALVLPSRPSISVPYRSRARGGETAGDNLFLSGGDPVALTPDGLACGAGRAFYDPWRYPEVGWSRASRRKARRW